MNLCPLLMTTDLTSDSPNIAQNNVLKLSSRLDRCTENETDGDERKVIFEFKQTINHHNGDVKDALQEKATEEENVF